MFGFFLSFFGSCCWLFSRESKLFFGDSGIFLACNICIDIVHRLLIALQVVRGDNVRIIWDVISQLLIPVEQRLKMFFISLLLKFFPAWQISIDWSYSLGEIGINEVVVFVRVLFDPLLLVILFDCLSWSQKFSLDLLFFVLVDLLFAHVNIKNFRRFCLHF